MKKLIRASYETSELDEMYDVLLQCGIEEQTLKIITDINGYSFDTLNDVARAAFGVDLEDL